MRITRFSAAVAAIFALTVAGCGGGADDTSSSSGAPGGGSGSSSSNRITGDDLNTVNTAEVKPGGEITMAIEKTISNWNTVTAAGDVSETVWVTNAIYPGVFTVLPDGSTLELNKDLMESAEVVSQDPTVVKYVIRKEAVWSDGTPITGADFEYLWHAQNRKDCPDCQTKDSDGLDKVTSLETSADGKTVTLTYDSNFSEWQRPFGRILPAHLAEQNGDLLTSFTDYFVKTVPTWSGGPYIITDFKKDVSVTLEPNPKWYGTKPNLTKITFRMITDTQQTPIALANNEVQAMYPQPQVDLLQQVDDMGQLGVVYQMNQSMLMETFLFNLSNSYLADPVLRQAIYTALDQQEVIDKTVGQFDDDVTPLGSMMIMQQQEGYTPKTGDLNYGKGDLESAKKMLTDAGYTITDGQLMTPDGKPVPPLRSVYSQGNPVRQASFEVLAATVKPLGITLKLETTDALGDSLAEKSPYGYDILIAGFAGSPFLASNAFKRYTTDTGYNLHYSDPQVDKLVDEALASTDPAKTIDLINQADAIVVKSAWMMPLYQKPSMFAYYDKYGNLRDNPTISGPTYNILQWGLIDG